MHTIENEFLQITVHPIGAELQSLYNKQTNTELLWSGDASYWGKFSPVLFPIVGSLKENSYFYNNKNYHLPRHGFAREKEFLLKEKTENSITFLLKHDAETLKVYPFLFELEITYTLIENNFTCTYNVNNIGDNEMFFSIGAHPAFAVNGNYENFLLAFNKDNKLERYKLENGLISNNTETIYLQNKQLQLQKSLFYDDAIVLKSIASSNISLLNKNSNNGFHFKFDSFAYFGIWAAKDAPFICLEPWCGIADGINHNQNFTTKEGINCLMPSHNFIRSWSVESF